MHLFVKKNKSIYFWKNIDWYLIGKAKASRFILQILTYIHFFIQTVLSIFVSKNTFSRIFQTRAHFLFIALAYNSQISRVTSESGHTSLI